MAKVAELNSFATRAALQRLFRWIYDCSLKIEERQKKESNSISVKSNPIWKQEPDTLSSVTGDRKQVFVVL